MSRSSSVASIGLHLTIDAPCTLADLDGTSLSEYMRQPCDRYVDLMPRNTKFERLDLDGTFNLTIPKVNMFGVSVIPLLMCDVTQHEDHVIIESRQLQLCGSSYIESINDCFSIAVKCVITWVDTPTEKSIRVDCNFFGECDPPGAFKLFGMKVLETTATLVTKSAMQYLINDFANALARDYGEWLVLKQKENILLRTSSSNINVSSSSKKQFVNCEGKGNAAAAAAAGGDGRFPNAMTTTTTMDSQNNYTNTKRMTVNAESVPFSASRSSSFSLLVNNGGAEEDSTFASLSSSSSSSFSSAISNVAATATVFRDVRTDRGRDEGDGRGREEGEGERRGSESKTSMLPPLLNPSSIVSTSPAEGVYYLRQQDSFTFSPSRYFGTEDDFRSTYIDDQDVDGVNKEEEEEEEEENNLRPQRVMSQNRTARWFHSSKNNNDASKAIVASGIVSSPEHTPFTEEEGSGDSQGDSSPSNSYLGAEEYFYQYQLLRQVQLEGELSLGQQQRLEQRRNPQHPQNDADNSTSNSTTKSSVSRVRRRRRRLDNRRKVSNRLSSLFRIVVAITYLLWWYALQFILSFVISPFMLAKYWL